MILDEWVWGMIINLIGSIGINLGTNLVKLVYVKGPDAASSENAVHSKIWWLGLILFGVGNMLNFVSMGFAPLSLLAVLGSIQFITNIIFSAVVLHVAISRRTVLATMAIIVGSTIIVWFGNHDSRQLTLEELCDLYTARTYQYYLIILLSLVIVCHSVYRFSKFFITLCGQDSKVSNFIHRLIPFSYVGVSAIIGTQSVLLAKSTSQLFILSMRGDNQFRSMYSYVIIASWFLTTAFWLYRMDAALRKFEGMYIIPLLQIMWTLFSILGGGIYFQEFMDFEQEQITLFVFGVLVVFGGVSCLSPGQPSGSASAELDSMESGKMKKKRSASLSQVSSSSSPSNSTPIVVNQTPNPTSPVLKAVTSTPILAPLVKKSSDVVGKTASIFWQFVWFISNCPSLASLRSESRTASWCLSGQSS